MSSSVALTEPIKSRRAVYDTEPTIFSAIYQDDVNLANWQRTLPLNVNEAVSQLLSKKSDFQCSLTASPETALESLNETFASQNYHPLAENISELVDMFCYLFELKQAGIRLAALDKAMCPKFHVDRVPCRLITTYQGIATEWLPNDLADRSRLGAGSKGLADHESGIYCTKSDIQQLNCGDVALLKGEHWFNNEGGGLIHRSPELLSGESRLLLTLDFAD